MATIRVLQIPSPFGIGGIGVVVMNYYRHIDKSKVQFDFVTTSQSPEQYDNEIFAGGGHIYRLPSRNREPFRYMRELKRLIKANGYQIVHIHQSSASMAMDARVAKRCGVPVIIGHSHNTSCNIKWQHYLLKPFVNHYLTYRFACSIEAGKWVFGNRNDVKVIHNALDLDKFRFDSKIRDEYRNSLGIKDKLVVGYVGRLFDKQKNVSRLIDIFKDLLKNRPGSCLLLVGDGSDRAMFEQQCESIKDKVVFLGQRKDVANLMMAMDVFVMTSWYEGLANTLIEAQAAGLKTILSSAIPTEDILGIQKSLSLNEPNEAWVQAILEGATFDRTKVDEPIAKAGYDIKIEAKKLEKFYMEAAR